MIIVYVQPQVTNGSSLGHSSSLPSRAGSNDEQACSAGRHVLGQRVHLIIVCEAASALSIAMMRADSRHSLRGALSPRFARMGCGGRGTAPEPAVSCTVRRCRRPKMPVDCSQRCLASSCDTSAHSVCMAANMENCGRNVTLLSTQCMWHCNNLRSCKDRGKYVTDDSAACKPGCGRIYDGQNYLQGFDEHAVSYLLVSALSLSMRRG